MSIKKACCRVFFSPECERIWERQEETEQTRGSKVKRSWLWKSCSVFVGGDCGQNRGIVFTIYREGAADGKLPEMHRMTLMCRGPSEERYPWNKTCCALWMCEAALGPISMALEGSIVMRWIWACQSSPFICWSVEPPGHTVQYRVRPVLWSMEFPHIWETRALKTPTLGILVDRKSVV